MIQRIVLSLLTMTLFGIVCRADTVHLNDGSTLEGRVIDQGDKYWIKDNDGQTHLIDKSTVASVTRNTPVAVTSGSAIDSTPTGKLPAYAGSTDFATVKAKADLSETPVAAVALWQAFIDAKPGAKDLLAAQAQLKKWQDMFDGSAEKVNGKWIWGDDRQKLLKHVSQLIHEGEAALRGNQTLLGISKFEEAVKIYPNNFEANFELGYFNLLKGVEGGRNNAKIDAGIKLLETAVKLQPDSAATLSDLAIGYSFRQKYQLSVETAYKAAKLQDSREVVQNLVNSIAYAPPGMQNNTNIRPILQEAMILAGKYSISPNANASWVWVRPSRSNAIERGEPGAGDEEQKDGPAGIFGEGSGFFISANGYILTNRHVAKPGDYLMVRLADGTLKLAERVVIDDEQDMAVIKIKVSEPEPFVRLAGYNHPAVGADVAVFGFPLLDRFGLKSSVKMTRGIVTAWDQGNELCDVTVDAAVNPGNSGGPMVDHHGNLLALTAMKTIATDAMVSSYGLGYSDERIRKFFAKERGKLAAAHLTDGSDLGPVLSNEDLATRLTPATVCILMCRGTPPTATAP